MEMTIKLSGLFEESKRKAWEKDYKEKIYKAVKKGMEQSVAELKQEIRNDAAKHLKIKKKSFLGTLTGKVYSSKKDAMPDLHMFAKSEIMQAHEDGANIKGPLLIPLLEGKRIGTKRFKKIIQNLIDNGNAYFLKRNGYTVVMAENIKENSRDLSKFRKAERTRTGANSIKKGTEIPIAIIVNSVKLKKRVNLVNITQKNIGKITKNIENSFDFREK